MWPNWTHLMWIQISLSIQQQKHLPRPWPCVSLEWFIKQNQVIKSKACLIRQNLVQSSSHSVNYYSIVCRLLRHIASGRIFFEVSFNFFSNVIFHFCLLLVNNDGLKNMIQLMIYNNFVKKKLKFDFCISESLHGF